MTKLGHRRTVYCRRDLKVKIGGSNHSLFERGSFYMALELDGTISVFSKDWTYRGPLEDFKRYFIKVKKGYEKMKIFSGIMTQTLLSRVYQEAKNVGAGVIVLKITDDSTETSELQEFIVSDFPKKIEELRTACDRNLHFIEDKNKRISQLRYY